MLRLCAVPSEPTRSRCGLRMALDSQVLQSKPHLGGRSIWPALKAHRCERMGRQRAWTATRWAGSLYCDRTVCTLRMFALGGAPHRSVRACPCSTFAVSGRVANPAPKPGAPLLGALALIKRPTTNRSTPPAAQDGWSVLQGCRAAEPCRVLNESKIRFQGFSFSVPVSIL
jgi:hypothetical protein